MCQETLCALNTSVFTQFFVAARAPACGSHMFQGYQFRGAQTCSSWFLLGVRAEPFGAQILSFPLIVCSKQI